MENTSTSPMGFVQRRLPWLIAGGALLIYILTQHTWITFRGLPTLVRVAGWDWRPVYHEPLHFLVTYPLRWLPAAWQVVGANFFSTLCSVFALALLARSVALLPHDRTRDQRQHERSDHSFLTIRLAWLPPLLAALVCGLQLTFWEGAVVSTSEGVNVVLFAYVLRCLLEFRVGERDAWLWRAGLVFALGVTNSFIIAGLLPGLLITMVWMKGLSFFKLRFVLRLAGSMLAGLLLYLLLPIVMLLTDQSDQSFWELLRMNIGYQKNQLLGFPKFPNLFLISLTSIMPVLVMGIRWPASFGDINAVGNALTNLMSHVLHAIFLAACLYVSFDPPISPRRAGFGIPMLPFYYLAALSVGYYSGYFLLVFGAPPGRSWQRLSLPRRILERGLFAVVCLAAVAVPAGLVYRNYPQLRANDGPELSRFGVLAAQELPAGGALVLSDDPYRLFSLHAALRRSGASDKHLLIDTGSLPYPGYHRHLRRQLGERWPKLPYERALTEQVDSATLLQMMTQLTQGRDTFYLQPSFGYYFEYFYAKPHNLIYELKPLPTDSVSPPPLSPAEIKANEEFWTRLKSTELAPIFESARKRSKGKKSTLGYGSFMAAMYSRSLNFLGVEAQRAGDYAKAAGLFATALELNPDNAAAFLNLEFNRHWRAGRRDRLEPSAEALKRLEPFRGQWDYLLGVNGPVDDPNFCFLLANVFAAGNNFRQSAQQLERAVALNPDDLFAHSGLAELYIRLRFPDKALAAIKQMRARPQFAELSPEAGLALIQIEAWALASKDDLASAEKLLQAAQQKFPKEEGPFRALSEIYQTAGRATNAVQVYEAQVRNQPENSGALINYAALRMKLKDFAGAIPLLDRALQIDAQSTMALMNRAIAHLQTDRLDAAQTDYEKVQSLLSKPSHLVSYGLGEIAFRRKNAKLAIQHYEQYLKLAPPGTPEAKQVRERLQNLKSGKF